MKQNYNYVYGGVIVGVEGEETVKILNYERVDILVTREKEYYNIYIIHPAFKQEPLNNLYCQEPITNGEPSDLQLELYAIQYDLWYRHNKDFSITYSEIE